MCLTILFRPPLALVGAAAISLLAGLLAYSQASNGNGRSYIDKTVAALGGDSFLKMQTRIEKGRIYGFFHDRLSGSELVKRYVAYVGSPSAAGLAIQERDLLGKKQDYSSLFLSNRAWDVTYRGARPIPDEDWERYYRTTRNDILYILRCRLDEPGLQFEYVGSDIYLSRHVEIVDVTDATDQTVRVYLDHNTLLPMHAKFDWFDEKTREHNDQAYEYDKYRDAGSGVTWPFVVERERNGYKSFQMFADEVQIGAPMPATIFDLPPGAKILQKVQ